MSVCKSCSSVGLGSFLSVRVHDRITDGRLYNLFTYWQRVYLSGCNAATRRSNIVIGQGWQPMERVSKVAREKIFLARGIHCCPNFLYEGAGLRIINVTLYITYSKCS